MDDLSGLVLGKNPKLLSASEHRVGGDELAAVPHLQGHHVVEPDNVELVATSWPRYRICREPSRRITSTGVNGIG